MVDRDFTYGAITVRLGNCATWCGTMVQPATSAGVQILSYSFTPPGGTPWSEKNPEPRDPGVSGSGLVAVGSWLVSLDSLVVFYKRPGDTAYSRNNDALAIVVVPYALNPADELNMVRPSAIGNPNTNATIAAHRAEQLWFNTATATALPSIIDLDVLTPVAGWPSWSNARPTLPTVSGWFEGFCGELWAGGYDIAGQTPSLQNQGYGRTVSYRTAFGMMMALSKEGTAADRKEMARRVAQWGVDLYGAYVEGRNDKVDGGHYQGRKALVVWAGHFLEKSWVDCSPLFPGQFHEDEQYYTASPAWVFGWPYGYKGSSDYPTKIHLPIASWGADIDTLFYLCGYFQHCVGTNIGQALAMRLIGRTAEMGVAHDGMMAQWMTKPDASTLAAIDAIVVTALYQGQLYTGHPRNIPWGTSYATNSTGDGYDRFAEAAWKVYSDYAVPSGGPEIEVAGLSNAIIDGDSTPTVVDGTSFGTIQQGGATVTSSFVVTNIGDEDLVISGVTVPTGFTNTGPSSGTLPPGAAAVLTIRLDSATAGTKSGQVTISSNDADEATFNFSILGVVNAAPTFPNIQVTGGSGNFSPVIADGDSTPSVADGTDYGANTQDLTSGARILHTFTVSNAGDATLTVSSVTVPTGFTVTTALPGSIAAGSSSPLVVGLDLATIGTKSGDITINTNDPDTAAHNFAVVGAVVAPPTIPDITVDDIVNGASYPPVGDNRDFGYIAVSGTPPTRDFVVNNVGDGPLSIISVTVPTGYTVTGALAGSIAAGDTDTLTVRLDTAVGGTKTGLVTINSNDPEEPAFTFTITGTVGTAPTTPPPQANGFFLTGS